MKSCHCAWVIVFQAGEQGARANADRCTSQGELSSGVAVVMAHLGVGLERALEQIYDSNNGARKKAQAADSIKDKR
jgi:hypothetical protein